MNGVTCVFSAPGIEADDEIIAMIRREKVRERSGGHRGRQIPNHCKALGVRTELPSRMFDRRPKTGKTVASGNSKQLSPARENDITRWYKNKLDYARESGKISQKINGWHTVRRSYDLFFVIIPHFTKSDTLLLERAVASVPDREDIEVLVVDNSPNKIDRHLFNHRSNVRILFSDNTKGCGHARNVGMEQAKGVWMLFLDADDFFTERAFQVFDSYRDAKFDVIFFKMTSCYSDTLKPAHRHELYIEKIDKFLKDGDEYALRYRWSPAWSRMVKAILVKTNDMWWEEVPASEDSVLARNSG